jgi:hypothetical protein
MLNPRESLGRREYGLILDKLFGKDYGEENFLSLADRRRLAPWTAKTESFNEEVIVNRDEPRRRTLAPLGPMDSAWIKAVINNRVAPGSVSFGQSIESQREERGRRIADPMKRDTWNEALRDPNRPINDMTGLKVSPKKYNPKTRRWEL